jgi:bifunctional enzyme CysN/CysC
VIDAPGHKEFLKNMITGAASAQAALLVIDAQEGVQEQSRRHGFLLSLLGVGQLAVIVNKMDLVGHDANRFGAIVAEYGAYLRSLGVEPHVFIPVSARDGDNIASRSAVTPWYQGPTVLGALDGFALPPSLADRPLRLPIQGVYKFDDRRILAGRIESGRLQIGDVLTFSPSNKTARVKTLECWNAPEPLTTAEAGMSVGFTLDEQLFVERGEVASQATELPVETNVFRAKLFWLGHKPLAKGRRYTFKLNATEAEVVVERVDKVIDTGDLSEAAADQVERNAVAEVVLRSRRLLAVDEAQANPMTGRFVLVEDYLPVGGGLIDMDGYPDQRETYTNRSTNITPVGHAVALDLRSRRNGHQGGVIWLTGLSGSGKSTLALALEDRLFKDGYQVYVLDGDNVRSGLNANLGFSPEDRTENIRRIGEVAALFADAGFIVITSFISPYRSDRGRAREAAKDNFHEIYVEAPLNVCETRDPKGLYRRARAGEIADFTGIDSPYEPPENAELVVPTHQLEPEECLERLVDYVERRFRISL